jgi:hypothetical protein
MKTKHRDIEQYCYQFLENPKVNPFSGRSIRKGGETFNNLMDLCEKNGIIEKCKQLEKNPLYNPFTGKRLSLNGKSLEEWSKRCRKEYKKRCNEFLKHPFLNPFNDQYVKQNSPEQHHVQDFCLQVLSKQPKLYPIKNKSRARVCV